MTRQKPGDRPDAVAALQQWRKIRGSVFLLHRGWRLHERKESLGETVVFDVVAFLKLGILLSRRFIEWTVHLLTLFKRIF